MELEKDPVLEQAVEKGESFNGRGVSRQQKVVRSFSVVTDISDLGGTKCCIGSDVCNFCVRLHKCLHQVSEFNGA